MNNVPSELRYTESHEWAKNDDNEVITIGITDHAQQMLGDIVFVQLPELHEEVNMREEIGVIESVKAAADMYAPVSGEVVAVNSALKDDPSLVNKDPFGGGWLFKVKPNDITELDELLEADNYADMINTEE